MGKPNNQFELAARQAAERIEAARATAEQLSLLPAEPETDGVLPGTASGGRGKGKATSQLREWLAAKGYRMPEDVLARIAGLTSTEGPMLQAMAEAEQVLAWAHGSGGGSAAQRLGVFMQLYSAKLRALDALLPYGLAKVTPDVAVTQAVQVVMPGAVAPQAVPVGPDHARDVTPQAGRIAPPPMPWEIEQNQGLGDVDGKGSDA